jgi:hypothetical protein
MFERIICFFIGHDWNYSTNSAADYNQNIVPHRRCVACDKIEFIMLGDD